MTVRRICVFAFALVLPWFGNLTGSAYGGNGDFDGNEVLDLADFAAFQRCFTGAGGGPTTGICAPGDRDLDNDIDLDDWADTQSRFGFRLGAPRIDRLVPAPGESVVNDLGLGEVRIGFDKPVTIPPDAISIWTVGGGAVTAFTQTYDEASRLLAVSFDTAVRDDRLTIVVDYSIVDVDGQELDGEIPTPVGASLPSGNGVRGGQAVFRINILQGDADRNGIVDASDGLIITASTGLCVGDSGFDASADLNGDGCVNAIDANIFISAQGRTLPSGDGILPSVVQITPDPSLVLPLDLAEVQVQFSEAIGDFSFNRRSLFLIDSNGDLFVPVSVTPSTPGDGVTFQFAGPRPQCADYTLNISNAFADASGMLTANLAPSLLSGLRPPPPPTVGPHASSTKETNVTLAVSTFGGTTLEVNSPSGGQSVLTDPAGGAVNVDITLSSNRPNQIFFTATSACGVTSAVSSTTVSHDSQAPDVFIDFPLDGAEIQADATDVAGRVGDRLSGFNGLTVLVNGQPAEVDIGIGTNGTFFLPGVILSDNIPTVIGVTATDSLGNEKSTSISVQKLEIPVGSPSMGITGGNAQTGQVGQPLATPLSVQMLRGDGTPFVGKIITFDVTRSNGRLTDVPGGAGSMSLQVRTDDQGIAQSFLTLGSDAGCGNNRVEVTSRDIAGTVRFCATATPAPADRILIGDMNNQRGEAGAPLPHPFRVWVSDANNGVSGVPVTFTVVEGDGVFANGLTDITQSTDATGHVDMPFTLGQTAGSNVVEASFAGNPGLPATFIATGVARISSQPTTLTGTVLDNANRALGGARVILEIGGQSDVEVFTAVDGRFTFNGIAAGAAEIVADGSTADMLDGQPIPLFTFPFVGQEIVIVPNAANELSGAIRLPMLDPINTVVYDGTTEVILGVDGIEGLVLTVQAGTRVTLPGGTVIDGTTAASVALQLNQVHFDEIPMPLPDGAFAPFAWTLQPKGATFDPPVSVELPNMAGLAPGSVAYILQWDGQMNEFVITASGQVSDDGSTINSDQGVGITVAGWGGFCPPYPLVGNLQGGSGVAQDPMSPCGEQDLQDLRDRLDQSIDDLRTKLACAEDLVDIADGTTRNPFITIPQAVAGIVEDARSLAVLGEALPATVGFARSVCPRVPPACLAAGIVILVEANLILDQLNSLIERIGDIDGALFRISQLRESVDCAQEIPDLFGEANMLLDQKEACGAPDSSVPQELLKQGFSAKIEGIINDYLVAKAAIEAAAAKIAEARAIVNGLQVKVIGWIDEFLPNLREGTAFSTRFGRVNLERPDVLSGDPCDGVFCEFTVSSAEQSAVTFPICMPAGTDCDDPLFSEEMIAPFADVVGILDEPFASADILFEDVQIDVGRALESVLGTRNDFDGSSEDTERFRVISDFSGWTVLASGNIAKLDALGTFLITNITVGRQPTRIVAELTVGEDIFFAASEFLVLDAPLTFEVSAQLVASVVRPLLPTNLHVIAESAVVVPSVASTFTVMAEMSDGSQQPLQSLADGTTYTSSNQAVATVSQDGIVTGVGPGVALITVSNQGVSAVKRITIVEMAISTTIEGFVVLEDGTPAVGATVETNFGGMAVTDANGFFSIFLAQAPTDASIIVSASLEKLGDFFGGNALPTVVVSNGVTDTGVILLTPGLPDRDGDCVPDQVETMLGLDPDTVDSDGNGTPDGDEDFDGDGLSNCGEALAGTSATMMDTDGDGITDDLEDSDLDNLTNAEEMSLGTDPGNPDTDGDTWPDGAEVLVGSDPLDPASQPMMMIVSYPPVSVVVPNTSVDSSLPLNVTVSAPPIDVIVPVTDVPGALAANTTVAGPPVEVIVPVTDDPSLVDANTTVAGPPIDVVVPVTDVQSELGANTTVANPPVKVEIQN